MSNCGTRDGMSSATSMLDDILTFRVLVLSVALADSCARRFGVTASSSDASSSSLVANKRKIKQMGASKYVLHDNARTTHPMSAQGVLSSLHTLS